MDKKYLRLIDANLNRCREGLRVVEDTARFVLENERLYKRTRALRHAVDRATRHLYPELLKERDAAADAGRKIKEGGRENIGAVLAANFKRAEESLRVLEEYGRLISSSAGADIKKIRFAVYILEKNMAEKS